MTCFDPHIRQDRQALQGLLERHGVQFQGKNCRCPFHEDRNPSAGIYQDKHGIWRFKCHGGSCGVQGDYYDMLKRLEGEVPQAGHQPRRNKTMADKPRFDSLDQGVETVGNWLGVRAEAVYRYTNPETRRIDMAVARYPTRPKKVFRPFHPVGDKWVGEDPPGLLPLYNRSRIARSDTVVVVEGEKCVHVLHRLRIVATTSSHGCKSAKRTDWSPLAGKTVYLWPDNDEGGRKYASDVREILRGLNPVPRIFEIDIEQMDLPEGGDVADLVEQYEHQ